MKNKIIKQEIKTAKYSLQITDANFFHQHLKDERNSQIKCQIKSILEIEIDGKKVVKEISNSVFINPDEEIYKEILIHSKHIILT